MKTNIGGITWLPIFHEIALDVDCLEAWKDKLQIHETPELPISNEAAANDSVCAARHSVNASHPVLAWLQHNIETFVPSAREGQQQRLDDTGCTFLCQERGSNNGSTPSYVKLEGQQQRLNNTGCTFLRQARGAATTPSRQYLAGAPLLMSREGQQHWLNDVWSRMKAEARCSSCSKRKCVLNMKEFIK
jgi:hypothetical protein